MEEDEKISDYAHMYLDNGILAWKLIMEYSFENG